MSYNVQKSTSEEWDAEYSRYLDRQAEEEMCAEKGHLRGSWYKIRGRISCYCGEHRTVLVQ